MQIRQATSQDVQQVSYMYEKLQESLQYLRKIKLTKSQMKKRFNKSDMKNIFVAEEKNKAIGFITIYSKDGEAELGWMGVSPEWRNKGVGKKLVRKIEIKAQKLGIKVLRVRTVGEAKPKYKPYIQTVAFYKSCGFGVEKKEKEKEEKGCKYRMYTFRKKLNRF